MTFQLTREVFQVAFLVTFRIGFRCVHIAFAVHHFIISPVDDGATGYAYFEYFRVTEQQGSGHVPSKAPTVHADASAVYVREGFQEFDTFYLVFAFFNAEATEGGVLKLQSAVTAATIVDRKHDIAFVGHIRVPATCAILPASGDTLGMRTSVDVNNGWIFLVRVKVCRLHQAVVKVGCAVGRFDCPGFNTWHLITFIRVFGSQQVYGFFEVLCIYQINDARLVFSGITVDKERPGSVEHSVVFTLFTAIERAAHLSVVHVYCEMTASQALYGGEDNFFPLSVEA